MGDNFISTKKDVHLDHNANCFVGSLESLLNYFNVNGRFLTSRHLGFLYTNNGRRDHNKFFISCFFIDDMLDALKDIEGIIFNVRKTDDVTEAEDALVSTLTKKNPAMVFVDTFFLEFFPKKQGHEVHILVVSEINLNKEYFAVHSSLPYNGIISFRKLAIARNSRINDEWVKNAWLEFYFSNNNFVFSESYILSIIKSNINAMNKTEHMSEKRMRGIQAMKKFRDDFKFWKQNLDQASFYQLLHNIFLQLLFLVDQRKRYVEFLGQISQIVNYDLSDTIRLYKKISLDWEIFRNLCFKLSKGAIQEDNRLENRLNLLIDEEEMAISKLNVFCEALSS